jgi:callose synthase
VFVTNRGGFAKASKIINVSEDIFAGFNVALRGGESRHIEYMQASLSTTVYQIVCICLNALQIVCICLNALRLQMGKGRDIGMLQIAQFEAKTSGGSCISMTSRDACRMSHGLEFFRMLSFWHTYGGYYG